MLGIWARGLRPRPGPPLSGVTSPRLSNSRRQQTLAALQVSRDYRHLRQKLDDGVIPSLSSSRIWQINCRFNSTQSSFQQNVTPRKTTILSRFLPAPILSKTPQNVSSLRKIFAFAKPEKKPLLIAIGLLLVSSTVSMSVPFTIGKLIDFFSSSNSVRIFSLYTALLLKSCIANTTWSFYVASLRPTSILLHYGGSCECWSCNANENIRSASRCFLNICH